MKDTHMELEVKREPVFLPGIWRKLTYTLLMGVLIPLTTIMIMLLLILIAINPSAWRQPSPRTLGSWRADGSKSE
jgi:hypothetical protein